MNHRRHRWKEFLEEDNGRLSSMRLVLVGTFLLAAAYATACILWPHLQDQAIPFYAFASAVVGMKAFQKTREESTDPTNTTTDHHDL